MGVAFLEIVVVLSTVNMLEIAPLFFIGATLIFIGIDLMFEWLYEIKHKLLLNEYMILLATFVAIQFLGIGTGIVVGIVVAVIEYVLANANVASLHVTQMQSKKIWKVKERRLLYRHAFGGKHPKIKTFELNGCIFFGSSLQLFKKISKEIGLEETEIPEERMPSCRASISIGMGMSFMVDSERESLVSSSPKFVILDLFRVPIIDASAARGCFLQLAKMSAQHGICICACRALSQSEWMLRKHDVAYTIEEEELIKEGKLNLFDGEKILLFSNMNEALEFCEVKLLEDLGHLGDVAEESSPEDDTLTNVSSVFAGVLQLETENLTLLDDKPFSEQLQFNQDDSVFRIGSKSDSFFVILKGSVAMLLPSSEVISEDDTNTNGISDIVEGYLHKGGIFGFSDFILEQPREFNAVAGRDGTVLAKITRDALKKLKDTNSDLERVVDKVLLHVSALELSNVRF